MDPDLVESSSQSIMHFVKSRSEYKQQYQGVPSQSKIQELMSATRVLTDSSIAFDASAGFVPVSVETSTVELTFANHICPNYHFELEPSNFGNFPSQSARRFMSSSIGTESDAVPASTERDWLWEAGGAGFEDPFLKDW